MRNIGSIHRQILTLFLLTVSICSTAQYKPVDKGSAVQFKIKNFGFNVSGSFSGLDGVIKFDPANPGSGSFDVSIDANTINTDNETRDNHLREDTYFDIKDYPRIKFVSTKVTASNKQGTYIISGKLTIKKVTQDISFPFTAVQVENGYQFKGSFKINRRDFDVGGSSTISDSLEVILDILSRKI